VAGVTPPGAFRKMNSDVNVCSTLTANIIIMNMISIQLDSYRLCRFMYVDRYMETGR